MNKCIVSLCILINFLLQKEQLDFVKSWVNDEFQSQFFLRSKHSNNEKYKYIKRNVFAIQDILVLLQTPKFGHRFGHQALLIGDDIKGWVYYSLDGDSYGSFENDDQYTIIYYKSIKDFVNSEHNTFLNNYDFEGNDRPSANVIKEKYSEKDTKGNIIYRYDQGFLIETTSEEDEKMKMAAQKTTEKGYSSLNLFGKHNSTKNCTAALISIGLKSGERTITGTKYTYAYGFGRYIKSMMYNYIENYMPMTKQKEIEKSNKGKDVDDKLILQ